ncbi:MAG TPA: HEAT repeat domain-containing protein [Candidatus Paceibacterota bacterium]|nr:HEAT repeat domain-containing protein [Verrucomicrobiota bacterium]HRY50153.1 HEAT repeat domain-containing protein [Candidatus Paceibacterota bacterium]
MNTTLMNRFLVAIALGLLAVFARADEEQDLIAILQSSADIPQKCAACQRLRVVGTGESVPALAPLLLQEGTAHAARYALEGMPSREAGDALREALEKATGPIRIGLVDSLGWRHDTHAVSRLSPLLQNEDAALASAAAAALGRIGSEDSRMALLRARDQVPPPVQSGILNGLLLCAEQLLSANKAKDAATLYGALHDPKYAPAIRAAAWRGLVRADADSRVNLILAALSGQDQPIRDAALKVVRELKDPKVIQACQSQWKALPEAAQLAVLDAQIALGTEGLSTIRTATESAYSSVRVAAWQALGDAGTTADIPGLVTAAAGTQTEERNAARDALSRLRGTGASEAMLAHLDNAAPAEKVELLRALGERGDASAADVLVKNAIAGPDPVRLAALESLRILAIPDTLQPLLDLASESQSDSERDPILRALYAVCQASRDQEKTGLVVLESLNRYSAAGRRQVLPLLAELATPAALNAAQTAARDTHPALAREAIRVLALWPNPSPAPFLIEFSRASNDPTLQTLALRGGIEVAGQEADPAKRLLLLKQAMAAAKRSDEKKQALGQMGQTPLPEALEIVLTTLTDASLANEAGLAAVSIAEKIAEANPKLAADAATQVLAKCKTADIVKRAWALRGKTKGAGPFIQDWLVCGPYRQAGANDAMALFNIVFEPEKSADAVSWKPAPRTDMINLSEFFPDQAGCAAYLKTTLMAREDADAVLLLGSDDGVKAWMNRTLIHANNVDRGAIADQDMAPVKLKKGPNELMLKITQGGGGWAACARIVGTDGLPIAGLQVQAQP